MLMNFDLEYKMYFHACLRMWWRLCFKVLFAYKCIRIIFFYYIKKIISDISTSRQSKNTKK
jgi:hypothetical protein